MSIYSETGFYGIKGGTTASTATYQPRTVATGANTLPFQVDNATSNIRNGTRKNPIAANARWSNIQLTYANWASTATNEISTIPTFTLKGKVIYNRVEYPLTWGGGNTSTTIAPGATATCDPIPGLVLDAINGPELLTEIYRLEGASTAATNYPRSAVTSEFFNEGVLNNQDINADYTANQVPVEAEATCTFTSSAITGITFGYGGKYYTQAPLIMAYDYDSNGRFYAKQIATGTLTGDAVTGYTVVDMTPPAALIGGWRNPKITVSYGTANFNNVSRAIASYGCCLITGIPDRPVKSVVFIGDSIIRGNGNATKPDSSLCQGIYQMGVFDPVRQRLRCGVVNYGIGSGQAQYFAQTTSLYPLLFGLVAGAAKTSHALIACGTNDIQNAGQTFGATQARLIAMGDYLKGLGISTAFATLLPRCTGTADSAANQTPNAGFVAGGTADQLNAAIIANTVIISQWNVIRSDKLLADASIPQVWRSDRYAVSGAVCNADLVHPENLGIGLPRIDNDYQKLFSVLA